METTQLSVFNQTIKTQDDFIFVKPICDFFQIDYDKQAVKIKNDPILMNCAAKKPFKTLFGDSYPRLCLPKKGFMRWIQLINPNTLPAELREKFKQYQADVFDFFYGSAEENAIIRALINEKTDIDFHLKYYANLKRQNARHLDKALCDRYQLSLPM